MANNKIYYVISDRILEGPFTFKKALEVQRVWRTFDELVTIVRVIIDENGNEVKYR